jgi:hypothetical protein
VHVLCVWVGILPAPSVELREIPARPNIGSDARDTPYFVGLKFVAQSSWLNLLGSINGDKRKTGRSLRSGRLSLFSQAPQCPMGGCVLCPVGRSLTEIRS